MSHGWMEWSGWIFGLMGAVGVVQMWFGLTSTKTTNTIIDGNRNDQRGGAGITVNKIENGSDNKQRG